MRRFLALWLAVMLMVGCSSSPPTWLIRMHHDQRYQYADYTAALRSALTQSDERYSDVSTVTFPSEKDDEFFIGVVSKRVHPKIESDLSKLVLVMPDGSRIPLRQAAVEITKEG